MATKDTELTDKFANPIAGLLETLPKEQLDAVGLSPDTLLDAARQWDRIANQGNIRKEDAFRITEITGKFKDDLQALSQLDLKGNQELLEAVTAFNKTTEEYLNDALRPQMVALEDKIKMHRATNDDAGANVFEADLKQLKRLEKEILSAQEQVDELVEKQFPELAKAAGEEEKILPIPDQVKAWHEMMDKPFFFEGGKDERTQLFSELNRRIKATDKLAKQLEDPNTLVDQDAIDAAKQFSQSTAAHAQVLQPRLQFLKLLEKNYKNTNTRVHSHHTTEINLLEKLEKSLTNAEQAAAAFAKRTLDAEKADEVKQGEEATANVGTNAGTGADQAATATGGDEAETTQEGARGRELSLGKEKEVEQEIDQKLVTQRNIERQFMQQAQLKGLSADDAKELYSQSKGELAGHLNPELAVQQKISDALVQRQNMVAQLDMESHQETLAKANGAKGKDSSRDPWAEALSAVSGMTTQVVSHHQDAVTLKGHGLEGAPARSTGKGQDSPDFSLPA